MRGIGVLKDFAVSLAKCMEKNRVLSLIIYALIILFPTGFFHRSAWAEAKKGDVLELSIEELMDIKVESASRHDQKVSEAPAAVTIITAADIDRFGYRTLSDVLNSVNGFFSTSDRNYQYLGVRGFNRPGDYNTRVLLLLDGHRINDNVYFTAAIGEEFVLDLDLIDRIEIVRGPGSSLYGTNAFFGVINVIPKKGKDLQGLELFNQIGNQKWVKNRVSYGAVRENKSDLLLSLSGMSTDGEKSVYFSEMDQAATNNGIARKCDMEESKSGFFSYSAGAFSFMGGKVKRAKTIPTGAYDTVFNYPGTRTVDETGFLDAKYRGSLNENSEIQARLFYDMVEYKGSYPSVLGMTLDDFSEGRRWGSEIQINHNLGAKSRIIWGAEYRRNFIQNQSTAQGSTIVLDDQRSSTSSAYFLQNEYVISPDLILNSGLRIDSEDAFGDATSPRFGLIYSHPRRPVMKLLYGQAFRAPNVYEMYYDDNNITTKKNPSLRSETIKTWELAMEHPLNVHTIGSVSLYKYYISNLISQELDPADGLFSFCNKNKVAAQGAEIELRRQWQNDVTGKIAVAVQNAEDLDKGEILSNSPKLLGKMNVGFPIKRQKSFLGFEEIFCGKRRTLGGNQTSEYFISNLTLNLNDIMRNSHLSISAYNLFDKNIQNPGAEEHTMDQIPENGRTFQISLTTHF